MYHYGFLQGYSAGHFDSLAIDPAAVIGQERGNRAANIIGKPHLSQVAHPETGSTLIEGVREFDEIYAQKY
jgi:hypothetical protein